MIKDHAEHGLGCTVGCIEVPRSEAHAFGVMAVDDARRIQARGRRHRVPVAGEVVPAGVKRHAPGQQPRGHAQLECPSHVATPQRSEEGGVRSGLADCSNGVGDRAVSLGQGTTTKYHAQRTLSLDQLGRFAQQLGIHRS